MADSLIEILSQQKRVSNQEKSFLQSANTDLGPKLDEDVELEDPNKLFQLQFGFIPTFNVGSAMGVDNDVARISLDFLLDPINLALAFFSGGGTAAGKLALATSRLGTSSSRLAKLAHLGRAERISGLADMYSASKLATTANGQKLIAGLNTAVRSKNVKAIKNSVVDIGKEIKTIRKSSPDIFSEISQTVPMMPDLRAFNHILDLEQKASRAGSFHIGQSIPQVLSRADQVRKGERGLLLLNVPFTGFEKVLIRGEGFFSKMDKWKSIGGAGAATTAQATKLMANSKSGKIKTTIEDIGGVTVKRRSGKIKYSGPDLPDTEYRIEFDPVSDSFKSLVEDVEVGSFSSIKKAEKHLVEHVRKMSAPTGNILDKAASIISERAGNIQQAAVLANVKFLNRTELITKTVAKVPGAADPIKGKLFDLMTYFREKSGIPVSELERLGIKGDVAKIVPLEIDNPLAVLSHDNLEKYIELKGWKTSNEYGQRILAKDFDVNLKVINESGLGKDVNYMENYITHNYEVPKEFSGNMNSFVSKWSKIGAFEKNRTFVSFTEAITKAGLKPRRTNAFEIAREYAISTNRIIQNNHFLNTIGRADGDGLRFIFNRKEIPMIMNKGKFNELLEDAVDVTQRKSFAEMFEEITDERAKLFLGRHIPGMEQKMFVHAGLKPYIDIITKNPFDHGTLGPVVSAFTDVMERFNALSKSLSLGFSFFHNISLFESAIATMGFKEGTAFSAKQGFGIVGLNQAMKKAGIAKNLRDFKMSTLLDAAKYTNMDVSRDAFVPALDRAFNSLGTFSRKLPGGKYVDGALGGIQKFVNAQNNALWNGYHVPMKVQAFQSKVHQLMSDPRFAGMSNEAIKRQAGRFMDNAFGGQAWEELLVNPRIKQMMHWALFAPDWTLSNIKVFTNLFGDAGSIVQKATGQTFTDRRVTNHLARWYWAKSMVAFFGASAILNKSISGRWLWENPPGHKLDVSLGTKDEKGREQFVVLGKQLREPFRWMTEPFDILGPKLSPAFREIIEQTSGHTTTGFPLDFEDKFGVPTMAFHKKSSLRLKNVGEKFVPFSIQGNQVFFSLPRASFNIQQAIDGFAEAVRNQDLEDAEAVLRISAMSNLNISRIKSAVRNRIVDRGHIIDKANID